MAKNVFAVPVFFIVFRETIEAAIIVSVLLAFLKQTLDGPNRDEVVYKKLVRQVFLPSISPFKSDTHPLGRSGMAHLPASSSASSSVPA